MAEQTAKERFISLCSELVNIDPQTVWRAFLDIASQQISFGKVKGFEKITPCIQSAMPSSFALNDLQSVIVLLRAYGSELKELIANRFYYSLEDAINSESTDLSFLHEQTKGCYNYLSEANKRLILSNLVGKIVSFLRYTEAEFWMEKWLAMELSESEPKNPLPLPKKL